MNRANILLFFCLSFLIGIFFIPSMLVVGVFLILGLSLICVFLFRNKKIALVGFCFLFAAVGVSRHWLSLQKIEQSELDNLNDTKKEITFEGRIVKEPDMRSDKVQLTLGKVFLASVPDQASPVAQTGDEQKRGEGIKINGKILVITDKYVGYQYGDKLKITGQLRTPAVFEDFNYRNYLAKDGVYSVIYWPKIKIAAQGEGNVVFAKILSFKDKIRAKIHQFLKPPQSTILAAMMLGDKSRMSDELKEKLSRTGLSHITAISGMHIAILAGVLMQALVGFGLWRGQAFYFALIILAFFIFMIGIPASAVRAGIMGGLLLLAEKTGRLSQAWRGLILAAAVMLAINPLLLKSDVGFQLSFLATLSIILFFDFFEKALKFLPEFFKIKQAAAMTLSAQILVWPVLVYNFGQFSLVAPLTNILVVPLIAVILIVGFLGSLAGLIFPFLGVVVFFPAWLVLSYVLLIINWFSALSFSAMIAKKIHWGWLAAYYMIVFVVCRYFKKPRTSPGTQGSRSPELARGNFH